MMFVAPLPVGRVIPPGIVSSARVAPYGPEPARAGGRRRQVRTNRASILVPPRFACHEAPLRQCRIVCVGSTATTGQFTVATLEASTFALLSVARSRTASKSALSYTLTAQSGE